MTNIETNADTTREDRIERGSRGKRWASGILGGILAAIVMAAFGMIVSLVAGRGLWFPMKLVAAFAMGQDAIFGGIGTIALGVVTHLAIGALFGLVYAYLVPRGANRSTDLLIGIAYGVLVYFGMTYAVLPWVNTLMYAGIERDWYLAAHVLYGVTVAFAVPLRRRARATERRPARRVVVTPAERFSTA